MRDSVKIVVALALGFAVGASIACSRQSPTQSLVSDTSPQLPFNANARHDGYSPTGAFLPTSIPAGTEVMVTLPAPISNPHPGEALDAALESSLVVNDKVVAPGGASAALKVMELIEAPRPQDPSYLRLVLTSVAIKGKLLPLDCTSVFLKSTGQRKISSETGTASALVFGPGRSLTFRLLHPAAVELY